MLHGLGVRVQDTFEIRAAYKPGVVPGLVVVLAGYPDRQPRRHVGKVATLTRPDGSSLRAAVAEAKDHGPTISLFFPGLSKVDIPIGSIATLSE